MWITQKTHAFKFQLTLNKEKTFRQRGIETGTSKPTKIHFQIPKWFRVFLFMFRVNSKEQSWILIVPRNTFMHCLPNQKLSNPVLNHVHCAQCHYLNFKCTINQFTEKKKIHIPSTKDISASWNTLKILKKKKTNKQLFFIKKSSKWVQSGLCIWTIWYAKE